MIKQLLFSVFDAKAQTFSLISSKPNEAMMIRDFTNMCQDPAHPFGRNPEDFTLMCLGSFDLETGKIEILVHPVSLETGLVAATRSKTKINTD